MVPQALTMDPSLAAGHRSLRVGVNTLVGVFGCVAVLLLHAFGAPQLSWDLRLLGGLMGVLTWSLGWNYIAKKSFDRLPFVEFGLLQMYVYWALPTALEAWQHFPLEDDALQRALLGVLLLATLM